MRELELEAHHLATLINAPSIALPQFGPAHELSYTGGTYIDFDGAYHWVFVERGIETMHRVTYDKDELLYWIFEGITFGIATEFEVSHRIKGQDFRRLLFRYQLDLLSKLSEDWEARAERHQQEVLRDNPFCDIDPPELRRH
jgi:L-fucose isomerase-like protein